jgi:N-acetylneuraminic acid mutarotase
LGDGTLADIDVFDPGTGLWSTVPYPFSSFGQAFVTTPDGMLYAVGGLLDCQSLATPVEQYNPSTGAVTPRAALPTACYDPGIAAAADGSIYVFGGCLPPVSDPGGPPSAILDIVQRYDPQTDTWSTMRVMPGPRHQCSVVTGLDGKLYILGGTDGHVELNRVDVYHPVANTWQAAAPMPTARRCLSAVLGQDGHLYAVGGLAGSAGVATVEEYDPLTDAWTSCPPLSAGRWYLGAAVLGNSMYVCGGYTRNGPYQAGNANVTALATVDEGTLT